MESPRPNRRSRPSEEGYMLLAAIFFLALFTLALSVALPKMAKAIQRDRELETMQRGKQYIRGIRMYYKKFGRYPPNVDALVKTNEVRFLRKKYKDPTTGKDDWKPIQFGQNKAPTAMGFFGQPLAGAMSGGGGCNGIAGASAIGSNGAFAPVSGGATDITGSSNMGNCAGSAAGATGATGSTGPTTSTDPNASQASSSGSPTSPTGSTTGPAAGQTFGGAGIIGFSPNSPKSSILVYKKKKHYNEWEFVYDPITEQQGIPGAAPINGANGAGIGPGAQQPGLQQPGTQQQPSPLSSPQQ